MEEESYFLGRQKCIISKQNGNDDFVGLIYKSGEGEDDKGQVTISFPFGYHLNPSNDEDGLRHDSLLLMNVLSHVLVQKENHQKSQIKDEAHKFSKSSFPLQAYLFVMRDYISHGYYKETETQYKCNQRGKINWPRTIKTQKPYIQDNGAYYLNFITKSTKVKDDELITLLHEYCVYESFEKMGWLISTDFKPEKPRLRFQKDQKNVDLYISIIDEKIRNTFNDHNRALFQNMKAIIKWLADPDSLDKYILGTNDFEYVWEQMIDKVYGQYADKRKEDYFPYTTWIIPDELSHKNSPLRPDTIMIWQGNFYILDAKYYCYKQKDKLSDMPDTSSIHKQITYGEYIDEAKVKTGDGNKDKFPGYNSKNIYNAFLLPFDAINNAFNNNKNLLHYAGTATGEWKNNDKPYEYVHAILIDVKHLMECCNNKFDNQAERNNLAKIINDAVDKFEYDI